MSTALLTVSDVHAGYLPGVDILRGLSLEARANEITLVIGPNGAGKSTLLRTVFAFLVPNQGSISFAARPPRSQHKPPHRPAPPRGAPGGPGPGLARRAGPRGRAAAGPRGTRRP